MATTTELQAQVDTLRNALRQTLTVLDWVEIHHRTDEKFQDAVKLAEETGKQVRDALEQTQPIGELLDANPIEDAAEMATLIGIRLNEPKVWDMGMQTRLDDLVERWKK